MPALPKSTSLCSRLNGYFLCLLGFFLVLMSSWLPLVAQMASRRAPLPHIWLSKIVNGVVFVLQMHQIRATPQMEPEGDSAASDAPWCSGLVWGLGGLFGAVTPPGQYLALFAYCSGSNVDIWFAFTIRWHCAWSFMSYSFTGTFSILYSGRRHELYCFFCYTVIGHSSSLPSESSLP